MGHAARSVALILGVGLCVGATVDETPPSVEKRAVAKVATRRVADRRNITRDPFEMITADGLLDTLTELTTIGEHNGWRQSTSRGEAEAIAWVERRLSRLGFLRALGLEVERQDFRTYLGIEFHQTRVRLRSHGEMIEVPADAPPGDRERIDLALRFDSDGVLNDIHFDPVVVEGPPVVIRTAGDIDALTPAQVAGRVVFLDYAVIDRVINERDVAIERAWRVAEMQPLGVVMVTSYSNHRGLSHGTFAADLPAFTWVEVDPLPPVLLVRFEDLEAVGVEHWADLEELESVQLTWDVDLLSPGTSSSVVARIPGTDSSRAVILGAHIDSPNTPGALDDGSGSVALLELARALDRSRTIPPVDLYLAWFGSEERGLYGSTVFASSNSELIDRSLAMLEMDCLGRPVADVSNYITLEGWPYGRFGDNRLTWSNYLEGAAAQRGIATEPFASYGISADNSNFNAYDLPNADMIFMNPYDVLQVHYDNHLHDPYDTVELAAEVVDVFREMTEVLLTAAIDTPEDDPQLRVTPPHERRALFVGSHTEAAQMSASGLTDFSMALAWEGIDVDMVPYGRALSADDLANTDLVVALPIHDYPSVEGDLNLYDEAWTTAEIDLLEDWVRGGGLLVLTNSAHRLRYVNAVLEDNEDWDDANDLAERFGVEFQTGSFGSSSAAVVSNHPLVAGVSELVMANDNGVRFVTTTGQDLARIGTRPVLSMVPAGSGEVLVAADLGIFGAPNGEVPNFEFWQNLAEYVRYR